MEEFHCIQSLHLPLATRSYVLRFKSLTLSLILISRQRERILASGTPKPQIKCMQPKYTPRCWVKYAIKSNICPTSVGNKRYFSYFFCYFFLSLTPHLEIN